MSLNTGMRYVLRLLMVEPNTSLPRTRIVLCAVSTPRAASSVVPRVWTRAGSIRSWCKEGEVAAGSAAVVVI